MPNCGCFLVQRQNWTRALVYDTETARYVLGSSTDLFNNGYRYLNWLIDVPMLLFQIHFVVTLMKSDFSSIRNGFWFSGTAMILTGYVGQFYEVTNPVLFFIWGFISTVFFVHILYLMKIVIDEGKEGAPPKAQAYLGTIWKLFLFSRMLYPVYSYCSGNEQSRGLRLREDGKCHLVLSRSVCYEQNALAVRARHFLS